MAQISVTATLFDYVTQEQYNTLLNLIQGLMSQYSHMFASFTETNIPPNAILVPVQIKVTGTDMATAKTTVQNGLNTGFGTPPIAPVIEVDVGQPQ